MTKTDLEKQIVDLQTRLRKQKELEALDESSVRAAQGIKSQYDALVGVGFTTEQAFAIVYKAIPGTGDYHAAAPDAKESRVSTVKCPGILTSTELDEMKEVLF